MTELHFLLNDLPAFTSHPIPSSTIKREETAAKNRKTYTKNKHSKTVSILENLLPSLDILVPWTPYFQQYF